MKPIREPNLTVQNVYSKIINSNTKKPYSQPDPNWSIPVYYIWRVLRYDLGEDPSYPVTAQGLLFAHPQETETKETLHDLERKYYPKLKTKWRRLI